MNINPGFFVSKFLRFLNRPALRNCRIDRTAKVGTGSNCIGVEMGRYSYMGKNNSVTNTKIGSFCSIASYCAIGGGAHDLSTVSTSPVFHAGRNGFGKNLGSLQTELNRQVTIGNDVWVGEAVFINDGLTIGDGAVIGAHSVVTHDVPPYAIVAGAPARILRYRFSPEIIAGLRQSRWWELEDETLQTLSSYMEDPQEFLKKLEERKK